MKASPITAAHRNGRPRWRMATSLAAGFALALAGCVSLGGKAPKIMLRLSPDASVPAGTLASGTTGSAILVTDPDTDGSLAVLRVPVKVDGSSIAYLEDATWVERPSRQFRALLAETIRVKTGRLVVEGIDYETPGQPALGGRLLDMGYDARGRSVVVRFDAVMRRGDRTLETRRFEASVPDVEPDAKSVAPALNAAANQVAGEVAAWVAK